MKDVFLSINKLPLNGRLRFGNFFVPFSLDQVTPLPNTTFMERAIPTSDSVANLELATVTGSLSFQSVLYATAVDRISATDATLYGAYVQAGYFPFDLSIPARGWDYSFCQP